MAKRPVASPRGDATSLAIFVDVLPRQPGSGGHTQRVINRTYSGGDRIRKIHQRHTVSRIHCHRYPRKSVTGRPICGKCIDGKSRNHEHPVLATPEQPKTPPYFPSRCFPIMEKHLDGNLPFLRARSPKLWAAAAHAAEAITAAATSDTEPDRTTIGRGRDRPRMQCLLLWTELANPADHVRPVRWPAIPAIPATAPARLRSLIRKSSAGAVANVDVGVNSVGERAGETCRKPTRNQSAVLLRRHPSTLFSSTLRSQ